MSRTSIRCLAFASALAAAAFATAASANPFEFFPFGQPFSYQQQQRDVPAPPFARDSDSRSSYGRSSYARDSYEGAEQGDRYRRQVVDYPSREAAGTVIVDTPHTYLYYVLGNGKALRYGIGVGRDGFTWSGTETVSRKAEWPDWTPPPEMIARQPYLPRFMAGGPSNPLGARAMYLGNTIYRIHGTNAPETIGQNVSSGCIRLVNEDVMDLYSRVNVGTKVIVLPMEHRVDTARGTRG
jgi:lipoprotein-anchoring transpeptidase ErfK/SrfK